MSRGQARSVVLWVIAADFPVLYLGAVTFGSTALIIATLAVLGVSALVAALVY